MTGAHVGEQCVAVRQELRGAVVDAGIVDEFAERAFLLCTAAMTLSRRPDDGVDLGVKRRRPPTCRWCPGLAARTR